jgi:4'-phosphopantetheinyl transferase
MHSVWTPIGLQDLPLTAPRPGIVSVYGVHADQPFLSRKDCMDLLDEDERARADRLKFEEPRLRYILARCLLRSVAGAVLGEDPRALQFIYRPSGKPELAWPDPSPPFHFNLTHSHDIVLLAVARHAPIGVDVEKRRAPGDIHRIAARHFLPQEAHQLALLPESVQPEAFFRAWTRKEACLKAIGGHLFRDLKRFHVTFVPDAPAALLQTTVPGRRANEWQLCHLEPATDYLGALAVMAPFDAVATYRLLG